MKALRRTATFVWPYRWAAVLMLVTTVLPVVMELVVPQALRTVIDQGIKPGNMAVVWRGSGIMLASAVVGAVATLGQGFARARLSQGLAFDLRNRLFAHVQSFSFANLDRMQTGQLMTRLSSDVDVVRMFVSAGISLLIRALLMIFGSVVMMFLIDRRLGLIMLVLLPLAGIVISVVMRLAQPLFLLVQQKLGALNTIVQENLAGVRVVKAYVRERYETDRFARHNSDLREQNTRVGQIVAVATPALTILTNLGIVAVVWFGGRDAIAGRISVGNFVAFTNYLLIGMAPLLLLGNILTMVSRAEASAERIWEVLDTAPAVRQADAPRREPALRGEVVFANVRFHYDGADPARQNGQLQAEALGGRDVLSEVSVRVEAGQRIALLGATGSGKSTLVNLVPRFYDANEGQVLLDGVDVREWGLETLRRQIGVVLQETTLFSGTIRENIAYGRPDAPLEDVIAAAQAAQAHDFIMTLPDGYESAVEERGANLSGGQKQRLAIARALLINPAILILDDSTSAVDLETETKIQAALEDPSRKQTTFIVAQRISSVLGADKILILDRGRIAAQGTHEELLATSPIYQEIVRSQLGNGHRDAGGTA